MAIKLSIVIPVLNEAEGLVHLLQSINESIDANHEIIIVNDGSTDDTFATIKSLAKKDTRIKCLSLSRNFGHQNALMAGMDHAAGDFIITMDGDGQHPPECLKEIVDKLEEGFDIVHTKRVKTDDSKLLKNVTSTVFYKFINAISEIRIEPNQADFRGFSKKVLQAITSFKERDLFLRGIFSWIGFKTYTISFVAPARAFGKTKYSFRRMIALALRGTTSFSFKPLRIALYVGVFVSILAFSFGIFAFVSYYKGNTIPGWSSIIIATMFLGGTQLLAIGLLGEYIASLFIESKKRPLYIVSEKINLV